MHPRSPQAPSCRCPRFHAARSSCGRGIVARVRAGEEAAMEAEAARAAVKEVKARVERVGMAVGTSRAVMAAMEDAGSVAVAVAARLP